MIRLSRYPILLILIVACGWSACSIPKEAVLSETKNHLSKDFLVPDSLMASLDTLQIPWQVFFKDSVLIKLIDEAFKDHFGLRSLDKDMEINKLLYKQSKARFYPEVDLNLATIERRWASTNSRLSPQSQLYPNQQPSDYLYRERWNHGSLFALNWELDIWGKIRMEKEKAGYLYQQSKMARRVLQTEIVATIAEDYYTLIMLDEQIEVAQQNHAYRDSTLSMIHLLYDAGEVSALAVQQAQTQVLDAASLISKLKEERKIRENNLKLFVGATPSKVSRDFRLPVEDSLYAEVKELPLYLIQNRPDILAAQQKLMAANTEIGIKKAQRLPTLNISLDGGLDALKPENWLNIPGSLYGSILGGVTAPLFHGKQLKTELEIAYLVQNQAAINYQKRVYEAVTDIRNSQATLKGLEEQLGLATVKQFVSENALRNSRMLFQSGFANYLEVINAQADAMETSLDLVRTKADLLTQRVQLYRALGGGWQ